jgi:ABC-type transport system substrate-binding protein
MSGLAVAFSLWIFLPWEVLGAAARSPQPTGEMRWALYVTISPAWFDPGQVAVVGGTPLWFGYALHDALVKPMPDNPMAPSLAESWTVSDDQRVYEFTLRQGLMFHNGDPFTAEDVKFTFLRYKSSILHEKVREVELVDPYRVRFHLHQPWPDFMTYYGTLATGAGWIVPKQYVVSTGVFAWGGYPDIDALFTQQNNETDRVKREALLHQIQQLMHERVMFGPIWLYFWPSGIGPRVEEPALMLINPFPWSAPSRTCA